jgi:hypothetical protein
MLTDLLIGRAAMRSRAIDLHRSAEVACQVESFWRKVQRVFVPRPLSQTARLSPQIFVLWGKTEKGAQRWAPFSSWAS